MNNNDTQIMYNSLHTETIAHLSNESDSIKIIPKDKVFGALKLIEKLVHIGEIPEYIFRNILLEYGDSINPADFKC